MEFTVNDEIWTLVVARRPADTRFSNSRTPGCESPLVRNFDNKLTTHADLSEPDGTKAAMALLAAGLALGAGLMAATIVATPHVKRGLISLKSKVRRRGEDITDVEAPVPLTVVAEAEPEQSDFPRLRAV